MKKSRYVSSKEVTRLVTKAGCQKIYREIHFGRMPGAKNSPCGHGVLITQEAFQTWISDPANAKYLRAAQSPESGS